MQKQQQQQPSSFIDPGVKGLRLRSRSSSTDGVQSQIPPLNKQLSGGSTSQQEIVVKPWGADDEAALALKQATWKKLRQKQMEELNEQANWKHVVASIVAILIFRAAAHRLGFSGRKAAGYIALFTFLRTLWVNRAPSRTLPLAPGDFPVYPIIGQVHGIIKAMRESGLRVQMETAKRRGYVTGHGVIFGGNRDYGLFDPEDREYMLKTNWKSFTKNFPGAVGFQEMFAEIMGRGIFAVDGDEWQDHRKVASHMFSANGLKTKMEVCFVEHGKALVKLLHDKAKTKEVFDFQEVAQALTFDTISDIAFGSFPGALYEYMTGGKKVDFLVRFDRVQQISTLRFILPSPIWKTMRWLNIGPERQIREDAVEIRTYVKNVVDQRKAQLDNVVVSTGGDTTAVNINSNNVKGDDLLSLYIKTAKVMKKAYMENDDYLNDAVLNFMIAGRDTTSSTLINLFRFLDEKPEVAEKMRQEFIKVVGHERHVSWDDIRELRYCCAVFNETLRLRPPVSADLRIAVEDVTLPSGLFIPSGSRVVIPNAAIGRDPKLWHNPDEFLPERWIDPEKPDAIIRRVDEFIHPIFWGGPRLCLGKDMARLETLNIAWAVLKEFNIKVLPGQDDITINGPVQFYKYGMKVVVEGRQ
jgi:cytochrome P450